MICWSAKSTVEVRFARDTREMKTHPDQSPGGICSDAVTEESPGLFGAPRIGASSDQRKADGHSCPQCQLHAQYVLSS